MKCFSCNSDMIPGIMPGSLGWCKAECDIDNESATITVDNLPYALPVTLWWNSDSKNTTFTVLTDHSYTFDAPGSYPPSHDDVRRLSAESPMGKVWIKYINGDHTHVWRSSRVKNCLLGGCSKQATGSWKIRYGGGFINLCDEHMQMHAHHGVSRPGVLT